MSTDPFQTKPETEKIGGVLPYLNVLECLHRELQPSFYLEVGVRNGGSLRFAKCPAIGIDPAPNITFQQAPSTRIETTTSDDFFSARTEPFPAPIHLAFIDGMHLFEYALRDFINIERLASPYGVIVVDDIFPNHPLQAARDRQTRVWTGDVWKIRACLEAWRPDLHLTLLDTQPTGLMLISGLDSTNTTLASNYDAIIHMFDEDQYVLPPDTVIGREHSCVPDLTLLSSIFRSLRAIRHSKSSPADMAMMLNLLKQAEH